MSGKLSNTQKFILAGIGILTVVVIVLWVNVAKLKGPYYRFEDAVNAGNMREAVECYQEINASKDVKTRLATQKLCKQYAKIQVSDYINGKKEYDEICDEVVMLRDRVLSGDKQMEELVEAMNAWREAELLFEEAEELKAEGDYQKACELYEQIPEGHSCYEKAQTAIKECDDLSEMRGRQAVEEATAMIDISMDVGTYLNAIAYLDDYIKEHPEDDYVPVRRRLLVDEYYNIQLKNIKALVNAGEEDMARSIAEEIVSLCPDREEAKEYMLPKEEGQR